MLWHTPPANRQRPSPTDQRHHVVWVQALQVRRCAVGPAGDGAVAGIPGTARLICQAPCQDEGVIPADRTHVVHSFAGQLLQQCSFWVCPGPPGAQAAGLPLGSSGRSKAATLHAAFHLYATPERLLMRCTTAARKARNMRWQSGSS